MLAHQRGYSTIDQNFRAEKTTKDKRNKWQSEIDNLGKGKSHLLCTNILVSDLYSLFCF
jgi:hypothetical protein